MTGDRPGSPATAVEQPFDHDSLHVLRATVQAYAVQAGLPLGRAADLVLAVHELATNVMLHGSGTGRVRVQAADGMLLCQVIDEAATSPEPEAPEWPYEHGHGLWIVRALGDRHTVTRGPGGTIATVGFALPRPDRPSFRMDRHDQDGHTTLRLAGDLDERTGPDLTAAVESLISDTPPRRLVLDLSGMTYWDSIGIAALLAAQEHVHATPGASMTLTGLSDNLRRRLDSVSRVPLTYDEHLDQRR
jgi:anti-anti-sigma factor